MSDHPGIGELPGTEAEWEEKLGPDRYDVLRRGGTERAFTGEYWDAKAPGTYRCAGCGEGLFSSEDKYDSGTGWPSFSRALASAGVEESEDRSLGMTRTEAKCAVCGGHLGHVFDDGPQPTGLRYCINSASLDLDTASGASSG